MDHKKLNRLVAIGVFVVSLVTYSSTLSPTVVFWDVGEFCAAAFSLQVPHPPGAPLFLLVARVVSMIPFASDIAVRMHFISAFASAMTILFLYLVSVRFIMMWRGKPETTFDRVVVYGSAAIGALSLTFSKTFWFNAVEAEVYGASMLFVSSILWLGLRWYERADWERSEIYLILIAYIIGLAVGVHLLAILVLFPVMLLFYFRRYEFSMASFVKFGIVALLVFFLIYPGVVKELPSLLDGEFGGNRSSFYTFLPIAAIVAALYGIYYSEKHKRKNLNIALISFLLIVLGYSTYTMVYIRANANPPMNENDPSNMARLVSYLNREQYGNAPILDRRWNVNEPEQRQALQNYTSDLEYFWKYQLGHMYLRYFGWNYVGDEGDWKEAGVDWEQLFGIPLFLGLFGAWYHWRKDRKMAFVATSTFLVLGIALVIYFNMQEPQPRERDYFYVGSFLVFSMWVGMGTLGIIDLLKEKLTGPQVVPVSYAVLFLAFLFVPANMLRTNFHEANRSGNYVAWDYSYNLLQSCEPDAILFTNGDNDTFPLWYLQDVEGIRRDIRIVNLSLLNTDWYISQLKNQEPYGAKKVPISLTDAQIRTIRPIEYKPRTWEISVTEDVIKQYSVEGTSTALIDTARKRGAITFFMPASLEFGNVKAIRVQDIMVLDIVRTSAFRRPVYFAMTVSDDGKIGLREYLQLDGLAFKLTPFRDPQNWLNVNEPRLRADLFTDVEEPSRTAKEGFLWRGLQDTTTYFDEDVRRLMMNYRQAFLILSSYYLNVQNEPGKVPAVLDRMEKLLPRRVIPMDIRMKSSVATMYRFAGDEQRYRGMVMEIVDQLKPIVDRGQAEPLTYDNPYFLLLQSYESLGMKDEALKLLDVIAATYPRDQMVQSEVDTIRKQILARSIPPRTTHDSLAAGTSQPIPNGPKGTK